MTRTLALLLLLPATLPAGMIVGPGGRATGTVALVGGRVLLDGKPVDWDDVRYLIPDDPGKASPGPHRVRFRNGEVWSVELLGLADGKLTVRSELFGEKTLPLDGVAALDFVPRPGKLVGRQANTLYRASGDPVPGTLLGLDAGKLRIDTVLGELALKREDLLSHVFAEPLPTPNPGTDEVALTDGTVLIGKLIPGDPLRLEHPALGTPTLPAKGVRSVVRRPAGTTDLTEARPRAVRTLPLLGAAGAQAARFEPVRGDGHFVKGLRIEPQTAVRYRLPDRPTTLRAWLYPVVGARGDVRVLVRAGEARAERAVPATGGPVELKLDLPAGAELELEVDFGGVLRFPCGVVLADPHLTTAAPGGR